MPVYEIKIYVGQIADFKNFLKAKEWKLVKSEKNTYEVIRAKKVHRPTIVYYLRYGSVILTVPKNREAVNIARAFLRSRAAKRKKNIL